MSRLTRIKRKYPDMWWGYLFVAPSIIGLVILNIYPFIQSIILSFTKSRAFGAIEFIGLDNYIDMFQDDMFWRANLNTLNFAILTVPLGIFIALILAVMLNSQIKGRGIFRTIYFLPMVVSATAIAMIWKWIMNSSYGILNQLLNTDIGWLTDSRFVLLSTALVTIWSNIGYDAILLLAGLQNISTSYYEAASLDGAGKVRQFFNITIPMLSPTIFVVLILRLMNSLKVFDLIYMMVGSSNPAMLDAQTLMYLFYRESFVSSNKGYGSAIAVWTVLIIGIVTWLQFRGQRKWVNYDV